jgi:DNA uptake protein ComE-like DNA-binding protein
MLNTRLQKIRNKLLNDPYYRMESAQEIAIAASLGIQIDANQASVDDWLRLPGLSIRQARILVDLRNSGVNFYCIEDIAAALNMPVQRLIPLQPVLRFCYYDDTESESRQLVNPNTATVERLAQLPFMDSSLAQAVVTNRLSSGPYRNLVDFQRRLALNGDVIAQLMYYLRF